MHSRLPANGPGVSEEFGFSVFGRRLTWQQGKRFEGVDLISSDWKKVKVKVCWDYVATNPMVWTIFTDTCSSKARRIGKKM